MREIKTSLITQTVARLCQEANFALGDDVLQALREAQEKEEAPLGQQTLAQLLENALLAQEERLPMCQDCGTAVIFLEIGQDIQIKGGNLYEAVEEGVRQGYNEGYLRKSIVRQPFSSRINTKDNKIGRAHV